ncbi:VWA domain-containing protein [Brevibacillus fluminis]|uniref:VWA domain-containing protein n=1 Tax=Brevibacillus fluminis TaxID=511487 RepID=A0A3M8DU11_9BACL|nr:VWA domain-containing protein [Brevibacillus fluminis]RNB90457.1 VWA domain-containing protein [Brevibacillus fluminis]
MSRRKINLLLLILSMVGGAVGFLVGEYLLAEYENQLPQWLLMGLYFGQYALFVGLGCLLAEMISPQLNGLGWKQRYLGFSWKMLVPSTLVMLFVAGSLFQLIYGMNIGGVKPASADDVIMVLDISDSMSQTDPNRQLFSAAADVIRNMDDDKRVGIIVFNDQATILQPLTNVSSQKVKDHIIALLKNYQAPAGGTNIGEALSTAMEHMKQMNSTRSMLILMSDGYSQVDLATALAPYQQNHVAINTVGISNVEADATNLLKNIAEQTDGTYYSVENANELSAIFHKIYLLNNRDQHLVGERVGAAADSTVYAVLRVFFLTLIGGLVGLSLGLFFDNKHLAKSFLAGGLVSGLLAGLILELGLGHSAFTDILVRLIAAIVMAAVLAIFTAIMPVQERSLTAGSFSRSRNVGEKTFTDRKASGKRFDM